MDLFYYGSQDIPLPLTGGRESSAPPDGLFCESCNTAVSREDLAAGRATEFYGLVVCQKCRLLTHAEEKIELYFCDRCQVSVPVYRVDTGEALAGDGRILCVECRSIEPRRALNGLLASAVVFLLLMAGVVLAIRALGKKGARSDAAPPSIPPALGRLEALLGDSPVDDLSLPAEDASATSGVTETVEAFQRRRQDLLGRLAELNLSLARMQADMRVQTESLARQIESLERTLDQLDRECAAFR